METKESRHEHVSRIIREYSPLFIKCYDEALRQLNAMLDAAPQSFYTRNKAGILHNIMVNLITTELFSDTRVKRYDAFDSLIIEIDNVFLGRFKKLDIDGRPQKPGSDRSRAFSEAQLSFDFGGYDAVSKTSADIGYRIDPTWTMFMGLDIVCQHERWSIPIHTSGNSGYIKKHDKETGDSSEQVATN